jgi:AcrR family transcriptional regulator
MTTGTTRIRLAPEARREQLLELGTRLLASHTLDELSIDLLAEEAGISRGLLYHYFANKQEFHRAVLGRAVADLVEATAPVDADDPLERLMVSLGAYVDYVAANHTGYRSLVQAANRGDTEVKALYDDARAQLLNRMFENADQTAIERFGFTDTPASRLLVLGWSAMAETMVLEWVEDPRGVTREQVIGMLLAAIPGALAAASQVVEVRA